VLARRLGQDPLARLVAGLEPLDDGEIYFDAGSSTNSPPVPEVGLSSRRPLWPHMTVAENVGYPLKVRAWPAGNAGQVADALGTARLDTLANKRPTSSPASSSESRPARALVSSPTS